MQLQLKSLKYFCETVHFFSKVAGCRSVTLLKMKSFTAAFQGFWKCTSILQLHYPTSICRTFTFAEQVSMAAYYKESKHIKVYLYSLHGNVKFSTHKNVLIE